MSKIASLFLISILLCTLGCISKKSEEKINIEDLEGIQISRWYRSEEYQRDVIDIMNFDDVQRTLNVTTICFAKNNLILPSNDSSIINLPANNKQTWIPVCPREATSYTVDIKELEIKS